jgi:cytochrome P450
MSTHELPTPRARSGFTQLLELDEDAIRNAHEHFCALRGARPVVWVEELRAYAVTGYDETVEVLGDRALLVPARRSQGAAINSRLAEALEPDWRHPPCLLTADPPLHTRQRQVVNRLFTPRRVAEIEPRIRKIAEELVEAFAARGEVDLVAAFAVPLPVTVIAEQLGVGTDRLADFKRWSDTSSHRLATTG